MNTTGNANKTSDIHETRPYIPWEQIESFMIDVFEKYGVPREDAKICTDVLLESDRRGIESHGCNRFKPIYLDRIKDGTLLPVTKIDIIKETPTTIVMNANDGMGMVASHDMMNRLIEKAKIYGMAGGAIYNSTHFGIAGYWSGMAEKAGMIGICGTNARPSVAPTFGVEPMMGTNPLTFTMPTDEAFPFNFDCATSIVQNGKIEFYERSGKPTPAGLVVTGDGGTMTDSGEILREMRAGNCALLSIGGLGEETGGYKGYGFTTIVEILSAALTGAPFMKELSGRNADGSKKMFHLGHFFFVINPEFFMGLDTFKETAGGICRGLRASRKAPGAERIYTAGEKEYLAWQDRKDKGVPVGEAIQKEFIALRDECGLDYHFGFED
ncbi:MAG: Ldh family oxidoreductase [Eubacteriales bacterium]|nr:Ldh family oxidoreductase [Eubacteriales bacterium]